MTHSLKMVPNRALSAKVNPGCPQSCINPYHWIFNYSAEDILLYFIQIVKDINPFLSLYITIFFINGMRINTRTSQQFKRIGTWQDIKVSIGKYLTFQILASITTVGMLSHKDIKLFLASMINKREEYILEKNSRVSKFIRPLYLEEHNHFVLLYWKTLDDSHRSLHGCRRWYES